MGVLYSLYIIPRDNTVRPEPHQIVALIDAWRKAGCIGANLPAPVFKIDAWEEDYWAAIDLARTSKSSRWLPSLSIRKPALPYSDISKPFLFPPEGESLAALSSSGALIEWEAVDYLRLGTTYPLDTVPDPGWRPGYSLEIHLSDDFVNMTLGGYVPCKELSTLCTCGNDLRYETVGIRFEETRIRRVCPVCGKSFRPQDQVVEVPIGATGDRYNERGGICYRFAIVVDCGKEIPSGERRDPKANPQFFDACRSSLGLDLYEVSHWG